MNRKFFDVPLGNGAIDIERAMKRNPWLGVEKILTQDTMGERSDSVRSLGIQKALLNSVVRLKNSHNPGYDAGQFAQRILPHVENHIAIVDVNIQADMLKRALQILKERPEYRDISAKLALLLTPPELR